MGILDRLFPNRSQEQFAKWFREFLFVDALSTLAAVRRAGIKFSSVDEDRFLCLWRPLATAIVSGEEDTIRLGKEAIVALCRTSAPFSDEQVEEVVVAPVRAAWAKMVKKHGWQNAQVSRAPDGTLTIRLSEVGGAGGMHRHGS